MSSPYEINSDNSKSPIKSLGSFVWELVQVLVLALVIIVPVRFFVAEPFIVSGHSMDPTFNDKQYLIINKLTYLYDSPKRGEVIVLKNPHNDKEFFIKRIVGLPGDMVYFENGKVFIKNSQNPQGQALNEFYLPKNLITTGSPAVIALKSKEYFVLGDNRPASNDSRSWGVLPESDIVGKVFIRVLPLSEFKVFSFGSPLK